MRLKKNNKTDLKKEIDRIVKDPENLIIEREHDRDKTKIYYVLLRKSKK
jgi:hypothetical protein